jgi:hypothetical protein
MSGRTAGGDHPHGGVRGAAETTRVADGNDTASLFLRRLRSEIGGPSELRPSGADTFAMALTGETRARLEALERDGWRVEWSADGLRCYLTLFSSSRITGTGEGSEQAALDALAQLELK